MRAVVALGLLLAVDLLAVLATAFLLADFAAFTGAAFLAVSLLLTFAVLLMGGLPATFLATAAFFAAGFLLAVFTMYGGTTLPAAFVAGFAAAFFATARLAGAAFGAAFAAAFGDAAFLATAFFTGALRFAAAWALASSGAAPIDSIVGSTGNTNGPVRSSALNASPLLAGVSIGVGMPCSVDEGATRTRARLGARA
ncbi:hypothetical protein [Rhodanobacter ginsenosidimutans]|uniref:hypothetical protein n=1 Tax=Rhodanobacter ginsenosidimutans TaxID=490571 RepID=UPI003671F758